MPKKTAAEGALFVRLPATAVGKLDCAAEALGMRKKDLVAGLVAKYVDPDSRQGLNVLGALATHKVTVELGQRDATVGAYSFQPYDSPALPAEALPEVLTPSRRGSCCRSARRSCGRWRKLASCPGASWASARARSGASPAPRWWPGCQPPTSPTSPRNRSGDDQIFARYRHGPGADGGRADAPGRARVGHLLAVLNDRIVFLGTAIDDQLANVVIAQLLFLESEYPDRDVMMYINSPGGEVSAGLAIYDTMLALRAPVATFCVGQAASMGSRRRASGARGSGTHCRTRG